MESPSSWAESQRRCHPGGVAMTEASLRDASPRIVIDVHCYGEHWVASVDCGSSYGWNGCRRLLNEFKSALQQQLLLRGYRLWTLYPVL